MAKGAAVVALVALALAAAGCGGGVNDGNVSPSSVEKKAQTLSQQTLDALRPVIGSARTSVDRDGWEKCTTETPGQHRFEYRYIMKLDVPRDQSKAAVDAARADFTKRGYRVDVADPKNPRVGAMEAHSSWWIGVGASQSTTSMFISVESSCVFTTHDPKTTTS